MRTLSLIDFVVFTSTQLKMLITSRKEALRLLEEANSSATQKLTCVKTS